MMFEPHRELNAQEIVYLQEKLRKISSLQVTDRTLSQYSDGFNLPEDFIHQLPSNTVIVNIGSGAYKKFENDVLTVREKNDIKFLSIDPSIVLLKSADDPYAIVEDSGVIFYYNELFQHPSQRLYGALRKEKAVEFQKERLIKLQRIRGSFADMAPELSLTSNNFADIVFEAAGPSLYMEHQISASTSMKDSQHKLYADSILRILKPGGVAYLSSVFTDKIYEAFHNVGCEITPFTGITSFKGGAKVIKKI